MIRLKSGRVVEDRTYIGIDEDGEVSQPYDTTTSLGSVFRGNEPEQDISAADLTPDERRELAHVMMERWAKWGQAAPAKLVVVEEGDRSGCGGCPFCDREDSTCSADRPDFRDVKAGRPPPDWCPLRAGDVVVRMQKREAT